MAETRRIYVGFDMGSERIGVAVGDSVARLARPLPTIRVDGQEAEVVRHIVMNEGVTDVVVGRPRNQAGDTTPQTQLVEQTAAHLLAGLGLPTHWQDESLTSVIAEERLAARRRPFHKADIDAEAAVIILQDYLDQL